MLGPKWSPDGRYLACLRRGSAPPEASWRLRRTRGSVLVLDARGEYRETLLADGLCRDLAFSPDSGKVAFIELREDEFGDLSTNVFRAADLSTGRVRELLSSRRRIEWIWAGSDALAVVTYDRLAVPTLSLHGLDGTSKTLTTAGDYHRLTPLEYEAPPGRVIYRATVGFSGDARTELWEVYPGQPAKPLAADDPAWKRHDGKDK